MILRRLNIYFVISENRNLVSFQFQPGNTWVFCSITIKRNWIDFKRMFFFFFGWSIFRIIPRAEFFPPWLQEINSRKYTLYIHVKGLSSIKHIKISVFNHYICIWKCIYAKLKRTNKFQLNSRLFEWFVRAHYVRILKFRFTNKHITVFILFSGTIQPPTHNASLHIQHNLYTLALIYTHAHKGTRKIIIIYINNGKKINIWMYLHVYSGAQTVRVRLELSESDNPLIVNTLALSLMNINLLRLNKIRI